MKSAKAKTRRTTLQPKKPNPLPDRGSRAAQHGYHIFHYEARFEVKTESRHFYKAGLSFARDFIGDGGCDEGADYQNQFMLLSCNGDGIKYALHYGTFRLLVGLASRHARRYRGWLLGADKEPLTDSQIARLLHIPPKQMTMMFKQFLAVKLIEKIELPDFESMPDEPPDDDADEGRDQDHDRKKKPVRRTWSDARTDASERSRAHASAQVRSPLKNDKAESGKGKGRASGGKTASIQREKENGNGQVESQGQAEGQSNAQAQSQSGEPLPLAEQPKDVDVSGGHTVTSASPPASFSQGQSRHGLAYGQRVYLALQYHWPTDSTEGRREICSFAAKHDELCRKLSGLAPPAVDALLARGLAEAVKIAKRRSNRNRGAVWHTVMDKLAAAAQQRSPP